MSKQIAICRYCKTPLIWTFAFIGAEYYCISCGSCTGMIGGADKVDETPELKKLKSSVNRKWGQVKKHLVMARFLRKDCPKCKGDETHNMHLTDKEKAKAKWAKEKLAEWENL